MKKADTFAPFEISSILKYPPWCSQSNLQIYGPSPKCSEWFVSSVKYGAVTLCRLFLSKPFPSSDTERKKGYPVTKKIVLPWCGHTVQHLRSDYYIPVKQMNSQEKAATRTLHFAKEAFFHSVCIQSLRFHTERNGTTAKKQTKFQVVNRQIAGKFYPCFKTMPRFPAQMGRYPCFKLHKRKRLNNIIITTSGKSFYFIGIFNSGSQKKDRLVTIHCFMLFLASLLICPFSKAAKAFI